MSKSPGSKGILIPTNMERYLDKFNKEMDKHWNSGALRWDLLRNNPSVDKKYLIDFDLEQEKRDMELSIKKIRTN